MCSFISLCLELQAKADLVAAGIDVFAVKESRQRQLDSCRDTHVRIRTTVTSPPGFSTHWSSSPTGGDYPEN